MNAVFLTGLIMLGAGVFMFAIAIPRGGEPVAFLRDRDGLETPYTMLLVSLIFIGAAFTVAGWSG
jgi:hypothetical protein